MVLLYKDIPLWARFIFTGRLFYFVRHIQCRLNVVKIGWAAALHYYWCVVIRVSSRLLSFCIGTVEVTVGDVEGDVPAPLALLILWHFCDFYEMYQLHLLSSSSASSGTSSGFFASIFFHIRLTRTNKSSLKYSSSGIKLMYKIQCPSYNLTNLDLSWSIYHISMSWQLLYGLHFSMCYI